MSRIILVMQYPAPMRYSEQWFDNFPKEFKKNFDEVVVLGKDFIFDEKNLIYKENFSPIQKSIMFETQQINEYMDLRLRNDDILFLSDISFPGLFSNILYHKKPKQCFSFCHGTSKNKFDYFNISKKQKWASETAESKIFDKIFVATEYHKDKLNWNNIKIIGLPSPFEKLNKSFEDNDRKYDIVSVSRQTIQKVTKKIERYIESKFGKIERQVFKSWSDYYFFLSRSKILIISSKEDTFNYTILDAIHHGCIPIAPNRCSFPEILPKEYLYNDKEEAENIIRKILNNELGIPNILCQSMVDNFYNNLMKEVKL